MLISNLSNVVVHQILEKSIDKPEIAGFYKKESLNSFEIAKNYRDKINPTNRPLTFDDLSYVRDKLIRKVKMNYILGFLNVIEI